MNTAHEQLKVNTAKAQKKQQQDYKKRKTVDQKSTILQELYVGAAVWVRNNRKTKKTPQPCFGPFKVVELDKEAGTLKIGNDEESWGIAVEDLLTQPI